MVSRRIEAAQKKVEERHFDSRKNLLEYDEVMDEQRKRFYGFRQEILDGVNCKARILEMIEEQIGRHLDDFLDKDYVLRHSPIGPDTMVEIRQIANVLGRSVAEPVANPEAGRPNPVGASAGTAAAR